MLYAHVIALCESSFVCEKTVNSVTDYNSMANTDVMNWYFDQIRAYSGIKHLVIPHEQEIRL